MLDHGDHYAVLLLLLMMMQMLVRSESHSVTEQ
jgi:hypothetical protein